MTERQARVVESDVSSNETEVLIKFLDLAIQTEEGFDVAVAEVFEEVCGECGRKEFFETVVPQLKQIYTTNYRKAGARAIEIIGDGAKCRPCEIGRFFESAISKEELEFSRLSKERVLKDVAGRINALILGKRKEYGPAYKGVVAVILYGSFARKNFQLLSDLDVMYVCEEQEEGFYWEVEGVYVRYGPNFEHHLEKVTGFEVDPLSGKTIWIEDLSEMNFETGEFGLLRDGYVVISPYSDLKLKIESSLSKLS